jgi:hypothetical protein
VITGVVGHLRWHRFPAATIEGYRVTRSKAGDWSLSATVVSANAYNVRQVPLTFVAPFEHGEWRWRMRTPVPHERPPFALLADLDPPEENPTYEPLRSPR